MSKTVALISLGCSKNFSDSEELFTKLKCMGFSLSKEIENCDLVLINTCGFVKDAKEESLSYIYDAISDCKKDAKIFVSGCLTERYLEDLKKDIPEVTEWLPFSKYEHLMDIVAKNFPDIPEYKRSDAMVRAQLTPPHYAYLKIAEGCDNTCNFCAIPMIRGKHKSVDFKEVIKNAAILSGKGVKEINLISQHLDYYGTDINGKGELPKLIRAIGNTIEEKSWLRLHYCYPDNFDDELINAMKETPQVVHYIDMPIQHASNKILARMGRLTTKEHIEERITAIRKAMPNVVIRSSFIVGFPDETEDDFEELIDFIKRMKFDYASCFSYSDEEGTVAEKMPNKTPESVIENRFHIFMSEQQKIHKENLKKWIGKTVTVLVEDIISDGKLLCRHAGQSADVDNAVIVSGEAELGAWLNVEITEKEEYDLIGVVKE